MKLGLTISAALAGTVLGLHALTYRRVTLPAGWRMAVEDGCCHRQSA